MRLLTSVYGMSVSP